MRTPFARFWREGTEYATISMAPTEQRADGGLMARSRTPNEFPAQVVFRTQTGSRYEIDNVAMTWRRTTVTLGSGLLRSDGGELLAPVRPEIASRVFLISPPLAAGRGPRVIMPSTIVAIEEPAE